jgi:hypothetical protein
LPSFSTAAVSSGRETERADDERDGAAVAQAMEEEFDALVERQPESRMAMVWTAFGKDLRRSAALRDDIATLGMQVRDPSIVIPLSHTHTTWESTWAELGGRHEWDDSGVRMVECTKSSTWARSENHEAAALALVRLERAPPSECIGDPHGGESARERGW